MNKTASDFITKFSTIPEKNWTTNKYTDGNGRCCAYGHCGLTGTSGEYMNTEASDLCTLFKTAGMSVASINDGEVKQFPQATPKQRILAALEYLKEQGL